MEDSRHEEMRKLVIKYHNRHPEIWDLFCKFTFNLINRNFKNYGAQAVFEQIRWKTDKPDLKGKSTFKINNNHMPFYSRAFMKKYPQYDGFFRTRKQLSKDQNATGKPELTPQYFD